MSTRYTYRNGILTFFDDSTHERVLPIAPIELEDDFLGTLNSDKWTASDAGNETELKVDNQHGGVFELLFTTTDQKQTPGLYQGDRLEFNIDKGPIFEARVAIQTLPTLLCEFFFGMSGATADGTISTNAGPLIHAFFLFDGSGVAFVCTDDNTLDSAIVTTGITVVAGAYHIYRIDMTEPANVLFFIDGVRVASGTVFNMSTGSESLQAYFRGHKASDVGTAILSDADGSSAALWAGTSCTITDAGANLLITANDGGGVQTAVYTMAALVPGATYKVVITVADGTGAWAAGDYMDVINNAGTTILGHIHMEAAGAYSLDWVAEGATDKIRVVTTIANLATNEIHSIYAGTGAAGALRIDAVRAWTTR